MMLTKNFTLKEFTKSDFAKKHNLDNSPDNFEQVNNIYHLCKNVLQPIREHFGKPVKITSGFRNAKVNKAVGGVSNSQHQLGEACDFIVSNVPNSIVIEWIKKNLIFDQLIDEYNNWIHVSYKYKSVNRQQFLVYR